jgi:hypothetical protein
MCQWVPGTLIGGDKEWLGRAADNSHFVLRLRICWDIPLISPPPPLCPRDNYSVTTSSTTCLITNLIGRCWENGETEPFWYSHVWYRFVCLLCVAAKTIVLSNCSDGKTDGKLFWVQHTALLLPYRFWVRRIHCIRLRNQRVLSFRPDKNCMSVSSRLYQGAVLTEEWIFWSLIIYWIKMAAFFIPLCFECLGLNLSPKFCVHLLFLL